MMPNSENGMSWLTEWYQNQCDGEWEHEHGIVIASLDNPGWQISISVSGTPLADSKFEPVIHENENDEDDWYDIKIEYDENLKGMSFLAFCGPKNTTDVIGIFKKLIEQTGS